MHIQQSAVSLDILLMFLRQNLLHHFHNPISHDSRLTPSCLLIAILSLSSLSMAPYLNRAVCRYFNSTNSHNFFHTNALQIIFTPPIYSVQCCKINFSKSNILFFILTFKLLLYFNHDLYSVQIYGILNIDYWFNYVRLHSHFVIRGNIFMNGVNNSMNEQCKELQFTTKTKLRLENAQLI